MGWIQVLTIISAIGIPTFGGLGWIIVKLFSTKSEIYSLKVSIKDEIHSVKSSMKDEIHSVKSSIKDEIHSVKSSMKDEIRQSEERICKELRVLDSRVSHIEGYLMGRDYKTGTGEK